MKRYRANAEYYDAENEGARMLREDAAFFLSELPRRSQDVLELAAGTARAAIPIAQAGHRVVALDYDADMLAIARRKRDSVGLDDSKLKLVHGDALRFKLAKRFDWICIFFNTFFAFQTLDEQDRLLQNIRRHLNRRGRVWIDIFQPDLSLLAPKKITGLEPNAFYVPQLDRTVFKTTDIERDQARQTQRVTFNYKWFDARGKEHRERMQSHMTWIFPRELQILLERNGFVIEKIYGNYDGSALNPDSPRMITRAKLAL
jgi:ubiquinone/menaquinone biosynthesis C-methylase UbiE